MLNFFTIVTKLFVPRVFNVTKLHIRRTITRSCYQAAATPGNVIDDIEKKFILPPRYEGQKKSVWVEYVQLAMEYKPINFGMGFPDFPPPKYVIDALVTVAKSPNSLLHQYTRSQGHPRLVNVLAKLYSTVLGRELNPNTEIVVTVGGYEALMSSFFGLLTEGDEAIVIEPFFDCYLPQIKATGATAKCIPLKLKMQPGQKTVSADNWVLDYNELASAFNSRTKLLVFNNPHNPTGKVFTMEELTMLADLCKKWNVICLADEVYEYLVFEPKKHIKMANLPDMWIRTISIGTAGKNFAVTGWKIGWAIGPSNILSNVQVVHQNSVYQTPTPLQEAVAIALERELAMLGQADCFLEGQAKMVVKKMDLLRDTLSEIGMIPTVPGGGFFMLVDWTPLESKADLSKETDATKDFRFTKWMIKNIGLQTIPASAFYSPEHKHLGENYLRICFMKKDEALHAAKEILLKWKKSMK